jgi:creatinine amidohydrolase/Fe(II)-dependent formamide hydrolase-like protein
MGGGQCARNPWNCADAPNPLPPPATVWIEEMTWMDVRDAIQSGKTTVIIPTGGVEPNGPWLVTGKHNYVLQVNCEAIARKLGDALCAPIVKLVPEGRIEPASGHMRSPGTISVRQETFRAILTDMTHSLKQHGFRRVFYIGDSGGNQPGQRAVADSLNAAWKGDVLVAHIQEYYDYSGVARHMATRGIADDSTRNEFLHDDAIITLNMFAADPSSVRYDERVKIGKASINGVSIADRRSNERLAREIIDFRATQTVEAIRKAVAHGGTLPAPARSTP